MTRRGDLLVLLAVLAIAVVVLFPIYWMVVTSVLPTKIVVSRNPPLLPPLDLASLDAYAAVWRRKPLLTSSVETTTSAR